MLKLGFNTLGTEQVFEQMLMKAVENSPIHALFGARFNYLEIGIAEGTTLLAVSNWLKENVDKNKIWNVLGIDLIDGQFFNVQDFLSKAHNHTVVVKRYPDDVPYCLPPVGKNNVINIELIKADDPTYYSHLVPNSVNFAVIDGCHGAPCVKRDFIWIESALVLNGIVAFHDAGVEDQGIHHQHHCDQPINVRKALIDLHLLDEPGLSGSRPGWQLVSLIDGDKSPGNEVDNGHGFAFFQRI